MKKHFWLAAIALLVSACASDDVFQKPADDTAAAPAAAETAAAAPATAEAANEAIAAAETAAKKADQVGFEWRDTDKQIAEAKAAAQKGDFVSAVKLAKKAEREGHLAYTQYEDQQKQKQVAGR